MLPLKLFLVFSSVSGTHRARKHQGNHLILTRNLIFVEFYGFWSIFRLVLMILIDMMYPLRIWRIHLFCEKKTTRLIFLILAFVDWRHSLKTWKILHFKLFLVFFSVSGFLKSTHRDDKRKGGRPNFSYSRGHETLRKEENNQSPDGQYFLALPSTQIFLHFFLIHCA